MIGVEQRLGEQCPNVGVGGRAVYEGAFASAAYRAGKAQFGEVLADGGGAAPSISARQAAVAVARQDRVQRSS